ncbi:diaminopimelate epimerase [Melioribacter sp. Ez-97]|uniref:diaminopimelate epimerase n=1 Tax=Melioribacter sp. Ez-97 TaxID=3423434 RepID=UPI003EDB4AB6
MYQIYFFKCSAAGNDFVLFDADITPELNLNEYFIRKICDRRLGVGADGIIFIKNSDNADFEMLYYNADGTGGMLCANGARTALKYVRSTGKVKKDDIVFESGGKRYKGNIISETAIKFYFSDIGEINIIEDLEIAGNKIVAYEINTGARHLVINIDDVRKSSLEDFDNFPVVELGRNLRYSERFKPEGINVNFIEFRDSGLKIRTYEKGVEDETLSCGTGSAAAAIVAHKIFNYNPPVVLHPRSGDEFIVDFKTDDKIADVSLTGPAKIIYKGELLNL